MRLVLKLVGAAIALLLAVIALEVIASESGEVVVVRTQDESGEARETRLWVVDESGHAWIRAGNPESGWLKNIQRNPAIEVERGEAAASYTAVPDPAARDRLNVLFASKYGWADAYIGFLFGRDDATPIRLDPR